MDGELAARRFALRFLLREPHGGGFHSHDFGGDDLRGGPQLGDALRERWLVGHNFMRGLGC